MSQSQAPAPIGIGVVGLGFMGRTHARAYAAAIEDGCQARLVAVADSGPERFDAQGCPQNALPGEDLSPVFDPRLTRRYASAQELLAHPELDLVSVCTPTPSHVDLAILALQAGKTVLLEKPVALASTEVGRLIAAAGDQAQRCLPAMCMRFWPGWSWLKPAIDAGTYGRVLSASFRRLCSPPNWSRGFYDDISKSGGALFDLHIHDADLVLWLFGQPDSVQCTGDLQHLTSTYHFAGGPEHVSAEGGWNLAPGFPFRMHFTIIFEQASAIFDSTRSPALVIYRNGKAETPALDLAPADGYAGEVAHALDVCRGAAPKLSLDDALAVTELLEEERAQLTRHAR